MTKTLQKLDWSILRRMRGALSCRTLDRIMPKISALGNAGAVWLAAAGAMLASKKYRKCGIVLLCGLGLSLAAGNLCLKPLVARQRPSALDSETKLLIRPAKGYSFPSGHTFSSFAAAEIIARRDRRLGRIAFPLAGAIAFSRLYLYVHFPSDVIGGMLLGTLTGRGAAAAGDRVCGHVRAKKAGRG